MIHIYLFGKFHIVQGTERAITPRGQKTRAMLAYLALSSDGAASREKLIGLLWSDRPEEQARASLRQSLNELRHCVNIDGQEIVLADRHMVQLQREQVWIDALTLKQMAKGTSWDKYDQWQELYHGELLEGLDVNDPVCDEWLYTERAYYRSLLCTTLHRCLILHTSSAAVEEAIAIAQRILSIEPTDEEAHRALMRCHIQQGNLALAFRQYQACYEVLLREFQTAPSAETEALYRSLRSGRVDPSGLSAAPPPRLQTRQCSCSTRAHVDCGHAFPQSE